MLRMPVTAARECIWPCGQIGLARGPFIGVGPRHFVYGIEVVVEFNVDLLPRRAGPAKSENAFVAATHRTDPSMTGGVQAIPDFVVVRHWHFAQDLSDKTGRVQRPAIGVPWRTLDDGVRTIRPNGNVRQRTKHAGIAESAAEGCTIR